MKKIRSSFAIIFLVTDISSCITTHHGSPEKFTEALNVSCGYDSYHSKESFKMISCTFENVSHDWLSVHVKSIESKSSDKTVLISTPQQLHDFEVAENFALEQQEHNINVASGALMFGGLILISAFDHSAVRAIGKSSIVAGASVSVADRLVGSYSNAEYGSICYGPAHALSDVFNIPAGLYVRKQLLVEEKVQSKTPLLLEFEFDKPEAIRRQLYVNESLGFRALSF